MAPILDIFLTFSIKTGKHDIFADFSYFKGKHEFVNDFGYLNTLFDALSDPIYFGHVTLTKQLFQPYHRFIIIYPVGRIRHAYLDIDIWIRNKKI